MTTGSGMRRPPRLRVAKYGYGPEISFPWTGGGKFVALGIASSIVWALAFSFNDAMVEQAQSGALLFVVALGTTLVPIGAGAIKLLNRTYVSISKNELRVRHRPVPIFPDKSIERTELIAVAVVAKAFEHAAGEGGGRHSTHYLVRARVRGAARDVTTLVTLWSEDEATYISQAIQHEFGLG